MSNTHRGHLRLRDAHLDAAAGERRVDRVVVAINPQIGLLRHAHHLPAVEVGQPRGQRPHPLALRDEPLGRDGADRAMHTPVDLVAPAVELQLEVERGSRSAGPARSSSA